MTDLTKASEAREALERLLPDVAFEAPGAYYEWETRMDVFIAAVRSDTLADVAARLPELMWDHQPRLVGGYPIETYKPWAERILAHLGGTDR